MKQRNEIDLKDIINDYQEDRSIWNEEENNIRVLKDILWNDLQEWERNMIILYAETESQRKVADKIGVSVATVCQTLKKIRRKIKDLYYGQGI